MRSVPVINFAMTGARGALWGTRVLDRTIDTV